VVPLAQGSQDGSAPPVDRQPSDFAATDADVAAGNEVFDDTDEVEELAQTAEEPPTSHESDADEPSPLPPNDPERQ
jgi:hypothetical protein